MTLHHPTTPRLQDIIDFAAKKIGMPPSSLPDGGIIIGSPETVISGLLVTWMATPRALQAAADNGLNTVLCHETFLFDEMPQPHIYRWSSPPGEKPYELPDHPNQVRRQLAKKHRLAVVQIHYGLDRLCIGDDFMKHLGITSVIAGDAYEKVYALPAPIPAYQLAETVASRLGLKAIRIAGRKDKIISKVGNLWGGVALSSNRYWMRKQIELGAEALICGEADEYAELFAREFRDTVLIETSHAESENIGLHHVTSMLKEAFPKLPVEFFEVPCPNNLLLMKGTI